MRWQRGALLATLLSVLARESSAQTLAGHVTRDAAAVNGAVVALVDDTGREAGRAIVRNGEFSITARAAGRYAVRVLQIGWMPNRAGPFELTTGQTRRADIELTSGRVALDAVIVTDKSNCGAATDSAAAAFVVWEEARKAFIAASLTRAEPSRMTVARHSVVFDQTGEHVVADSSSTTDVPSINPFASLSADSLARGGYITPDPAGGRMYWAPDADVLLSESFVATHCFRAQRSTGADSARVIGVAFTPAPTRQRVADVSGIVWVDRRTNELQSLDYRYVNASSIVTDAHAGGHISFLHAPGGRWIVNRWTIRYPLIATATRNGSGVVIPGVARSPGREGETSERLVGIRTETADVSRIARDGVAVWEAGKVSAAFRVIDSTTRHPVRGVLVRLAAATSAIATDSGGVVRFDRLSPGATLLHVESEWLAAIGSDPFRASIDVPVANDAVLEVAVPSTRAAVAQRCGTPALDWGEGLVRVVSSEPITEPVRLAWRQSYRTLGAADSVVAERTRDGVRDGTGYVICGVPRGAMLQVFRGSQVVATTVMPMESLALLVRISR